MNDSRYIEYLLDRRIMRKSKNPDSIHKAYSSKYLNWITEYLNNNQIDEVPMFIICNTLYKLPDTFRIRSNSFFVGDFYLFSYFYNWNYILSDEKYQEFAVNLCIKQYIESCYLNDEVDEAYWLCLTSEGLENYKREGTYFDEEVMEYVADRTDIQEEFAMIHEAGHYLLRFIDKGTAFEPIKEIYDKIAADKHFKYEKGAGRDLNDLFEECYCDSQAVLYVMEHHKFKEDMEKDECYMLLFKTLLYIYALQYIDIVSQKGIEITGAYFDYQLWELVYRMANMYNTLYARLVNEGTEREVELLRDTYEKFADMLQEQMEEIRQIILYVKETIIENEKEFHEAVKVSYEEKVQFIREYLKLL